MGEQTLRRGFITTLLCCPLHLIAGEWSGNLSAESQYFPDEPLSSQQYSGYTSISIEPEYYHKRDNGNQLFTFSLFAREDSHDHNRSHTDIRDLSIITIGKHHEWRIGIRKVFWGVTESLHLVDIINQTDLVENLDEEDKLGQPMINLALIRDWGTVDIFILPYFRERTFPDISGRPRTVIPVDSDNAIYESDREQKHLDGALRWSHSIGDWDLGISYFAGTGREPDLVPTLTSSGALVLTPSYSLIRQFSADIQATKGSWLWKLEALRRSDRFEDFEAAVAGLEYTFYGIVGSMDMGIVNEYLYDNRKIGTAAFQDDVMLGLRLSLNDTQSSEALIGIIRDNDDDTRLVFVEASRRFGEHWKADLELRGFSGGTASTSPLFDFRQDNQLRLTLGYYF